MHAKRWIAGVLLAVALGVVLVATRPGASSEQATAADHNPSRVEPIKGTDLNRVRLSPEAARRVGIRTGVIVRHGDRKVMPYSALLYDPEGRTFAYTSPRPLVFVRRSVGVARIAGARVLLSSGPPAGTVVVTVGSQELFGVEYEVEED